MIAGILELLWRDSKGQRLLVGSGGKALFYSTEWRAFFVSCVIPVGHVRWHAPSFHALLSRNHIHSAAKNSRNYE